MFTGREFGVDALGEDAQRGFAARVGVAGCVRRRPDADDAHPLARPDGLTGTAVTSGVVGHNPPRNTWALIRQYLNRSCGMNLAP